MKRSATKYIAIFCILLVGNGINSQQTDLSGSGDNEATTAIYSSNVVGSQTTIAGKRDEATAGTTERPSDIVETTSRIQNSGDDKIIGLDKTCMCDCKTGIILTDLPTNDSQKDGSNAVTKTPEELQETQSPTQEEGITDQTLDDNLETTVSDTSTDAPVQLGQTLQPSGTSEAATEPNAPACTTIGNFPSQIDCHAYSTCSLTVDGDLESIAKLCPPKMAFNIELSRCTRDISACIDDGIVCTRAGTFADSRSNSSYYLCVPRRPVGSFRKYHIDCKAGRVYVLQLGKCFIDINNLQNLPSKYEKDNQLDDEDIVKAELKQFKAEEKLKLREQKLKDKLEKKLQKELAKKAAKDAKEQAKLKYDSEEDDYI